jgi:hypothetical protein
MIRLALSLILLCLLSGCHPVFAASIPVEARQYQRELTRNARAVWGAMPGIHLRRPNPSGITVERPRPFAGRGAGAGAVYACHRQLDCRYLPRAAERPSALQPVVGHAGAGAVQPLALAAITGTASDCDRMAFALSAYNGGLGWVQKDRKLATSRGLDASRYWNQVEKVNAGRSAANFRENRGYPLKIIYTWQPRYLAAGWGPGECHDVD